MSNPSLYISCLAGRFFTTSATLEALQLFSRTCSPSRSSLFIFSCILSLVTFVYLPRLCLASSCPHPEKLLLFLLSPEHRVEARQLQFLKPLSNPSLQWDSPFPTINRSHFNLMNFSYVSHYLLITIGNITI